MLGYDRMIERQFMDCQLEPDVQAGRADTIDEGCGATLPAVGNLRVGTRGPDKNLPEA